MKNNKEIIPTADPLDENLYWEIIDTSLKNSEDIDSQELAIKDELRKLTLKEIIGFRIRTDKFLFDSYSSEMWCAMHIINFGGCSDDMFQYIRLWMISRGKKVYYDALKNPDSLINYVDEETDIEFESFWYTSLMVFNEITGGEELFDYIDYNKYKYSEFRDYPRLEFNWDREKPETMINICPKLYEAFSHKFH